jgi:hypothetical protein
MGYQVGIEPMLRKWGLVVRTVSGWETRGSSSFEPRGHVCHHDAIPTRWTSPPSILINGRSDLAGPLCNFALQSDGTVWLVAAGRANHAGEGGWGGLSGNSLVWGTEAQNAGTGAQMWPRAQVDAYARLCAATAEYSGFKQDHVCFHKEWAAGRKIDPAGDWEGGGNWGNGGGWRAKVAETIERGPWSSDLSFLVPMIGDDILRLIGTDGRGKRIRYLVYGNGLMRTISEQASDRYAGPSMGTEEKPVDKEMTSHLKAVDEKIREAMKIPKTGW